MAHERVGRPEATGELIDSTSATESPRADSIRIASLTLAYNQEQYLAASLLAASPFVRKMYVMYSAVPFQRYNSNARREFLSPDGTRDILADLAQQIPSLTVLQGEWDCEEDMRNDGRALALAEGHDRLLILDADEFYPAEALTRVLELTSSQTTDSWWCRMRVPFKWSNWIIDRDDEYLPVVVRLSSDVRFTNRRIPSGRRSKLNAALECFNMGFVMSDERMYEKTRTYSHAHQLPARWYEDKWLRWTPQTRNLHTRIPKLWPRTRRLNASELPIALQNRPLFRPEESKCE